MIALKKSQLVSQLGKTSEDFDGLEEEEEEEEEIKP